MLQKNTSSVYLILIPRFSLRFVIASQSKINLTVYVEDEYTYFADGNPRLAGATIILDDAFSADKYEATTDESGMINTDDNICKLCSYLLMNAGNISFINLL